MKLLDKIKDLFMDEIQEDDEVELEEENKNEYKEPPKDVLPKVMRDTIKKEEEKVELRIKPEEFVKKEVRQEVKLEGMPIENNTEPVKKFTFPIDFEDEVPSRNNSRQMSNVNVLKVEKEEKRKVAELYPKKEEVKEKPKFKATPVISPVYGILDKNYHKDEVKEKTEEVTMKRPSKKVDFETVRKKAFGNLADDIKDNLLCENCELYKEVKKISALKEDDLLYDMTVDSEEDKEVTIEKAYDNYEEFGVTYEPKGKHEDIKQEEENNQEEVLVNNNVEVATPEEVVIKEPVEEVPSRSNRVEEKEEKDTKVDADFFDLIDSMYKERSDD